MAPPMTPDQLVAQLQKWRVRFVQHSSPTTFGPGWKTHRRDPAHGAWGPVNGSMTHHTGDDAPDAADLAVLWNGRSDLPGPLAGIGVSDDGVAHLVGGGRSNHAGGGDPNVLNAVVNESYGDYPPATHQHEGSAGAVDGNIHFYGKEIMYSGSHVPTRAAYVTAVLIDAAIFDFHKWGPKSAIGHKEWSDWKSDPGHIDMKAYRADVAAALKAGPGNWPPAAPTPVAPAPAPAPAPTPNQPAPAVDNATLADGDAPTRVLAKTIGVKFNNAKQATVTIHYDGFADIPDVVATPVTADYTVGVYSRTPTSAVIVVNCPWVSHAQMSCSVIVAGTKA